MLCLLPIHFNGQNLSLGHPHPAQAGGQLGTLLTPACTLFHSRWQLFSSQTQKLASTERSWSGEDKAEGIKVV